MSRCILASYRPLILTQAGRHASEKYSLPPYIDGSCRREPDFQSAFPSISATCRGHNFAPRIRIRDVVIYVTVKGRYHGDVYPGWRLVSILNVIERFESHKAAAEWYQTKGIALPSNCIVAGNPPMPVLYTSSGSHMSLCNGCTLSSSEQAFLRDWDDAYRNRIRQYPDFLVCEKEFLNIQSPPQLLPRQMIDVFGRIPCTQNPPYIEYEQMEVLMEIAKKSVLTTA